MAKMFDGPQTLMLERFAQNADRTINQLTLSLLQAYTALCRMFHDNPSFRDSAGMTDSDMAYAAFEEHTTIVNDDGSKMTREQIGQLLTATKAVVNILRPNAITDDVPVVEIDVEPAALRLDRVIVPEILTQIPEVLQREQERREQRRLDGEKKDDPEPDPDPEPELPDRPVRS